MGKNISLVFFGTPEVSRTILEKLNEHFIVKAAVTRPDKPAGRKREMKASPVKEFCLKNGITVLTPEKPDDSLVQALKPLNADVFFVFAYGMILPGKVLALPKTASVNLHYSLLPQLRGSSPITYALLNGYKKTGISFIRMNEKMDAGDVIFEKTAVITEDDDYFSLEKKLTDLSGDCIADVLRDLEELLESARPQDETATDYTPYLSPDMANVNWYLDAGKVKRTIAAFCEWPQAFTYLNGRPIKLLKARISGCSSGKALPGMVTAVGKDSFTVRCGEGSIDILSVKPYGKNEMTSKDFINGRFIFEGKNFTLYREKDIKSPAVENMDISGYKMITLHHTNSFNFGKADDKEIFGKIKDYHIRIREFDDIGYHFVIGRKGEIFKGRDTRSAGAHVRGKNEGNLGIALIGDFNLTEPGAAQTASLLYILEKAGRKERLPVYGHRDLSEKFTTCPGDKLYGMIRYFNEL